MSAWVVFLVALGTALATGLGALIVGAIRFDEKRSAAISSSVAAGAMLGATLGLFYEGALVGWESTVIGALLGVGFIVVTRALLRHAPDVHVGAIRGARGLTAVLMISVMTVHSLTEGIALGVSFAGEDSLGIVIAIAIALHNIPEGVAISLTLIPYGSGIRKAAAWSIFTSLPQPLMAVPAYLAVQTFRSLLPLGLGFAGGAMTWIVLTHLLPEAFAGGSRSTVFAVVVGSTGAMIAFEFAIGF
jgi:zinc transporter, ZIP family